ncbi:hypothetical protein EZV62_008285 [Acer yangbiense]|uniref:S-locus receptor kinase C-terminal domain-containing protein n=1 Tax=Acer yangbiense TaxID=1000413 RepID=A0A5C7ICF3_9ROSI|nr:hypothetical protein EZV62_008285 [Acer yangbiense]
MPMIVLPMRKRLVIITIVFCSSLFDAPLSSSSSSSNTTTATATSHPDEFKCSLNHIFKPNLCKTELEGEFPNKVFCFSRRSCVFRIPTPTSPAHHDENHPIFRAGARVPATSSTRDRDIGDLRLDSLGLPNHTWELWCRRSGIELMDKAMAQSSVDSKEVLRWIHIGLLCVQEDTGKRPYMSEVLRMLENRNIELLGPTRPPLSVDQPDLEASQQSSCSTIYLDAEAGLSVDSVNLVTSQSSSNVASNNTPILV